MTGTFDFNMPSGWKELGREESLIAWMKQIKGNTLKVQYSKDKITDEWVTEAIILSINPVKHWKIKEGRKYLWDWQTVQTEGGTDLKIVDGDIMDTDHGAGEVIDDDVSTPEKMAAYLEKLA